MDARVGGRDAGMRYIGKAALLAGVSGAALAIACWLPAPVAAATYMASNETELRNAIVAANADADSTATILLTGSFTVLPTTPLPTPTKSMTIDTQGFVLSAVVTPPITPGTVPFSGSFPAGTLTIAGTLAGGPSTATIGAGAGLSLNSQVAAGTAQVINNGSISGGAASVSGRSGGLGVAMTNVWTLVNNGTISGGTGIAFAGASNGAAGVTMSSGGTIINNSSGTTGAAKKGRRWVEPTLKAEVVFAPGRMTANCVTHHSREFAMMPTRAKFSS
ncbi:hypothetical protein [Bosea lathyri]|uniref:Uncharacterized protein n=1 Tax=Bosea lathyri TaxID=1036778 RepID=A0A1H6C7H6_9HYPH|nr:hypothetical protein [Bosea lathyri]SEG68872.1 hypothetical protein SAMN04488115_10994 [Bosea lathyri]